MTEIYRIIPEKDRAYEWARKQQMRYFKKPTVYKLVDLDKPGGEPDAVISIFHKKDGGKNDPDIILVYWEDDGCFRYSLLANYNEIKDKYPTIVQLYEENGERAYRRALRSHNQNVEEGYIPLNDDVEFYTRLSRD